MDLCRGKVIPGFQGDEEITNQQRHAVLVMVCCLQLGEDPGDHSSVARRSLLQEVESLCDGVLGFRKQGRLKDRFERRGKSSCCKLCTCCALEESGIAPHDTLDTFESWHPPFSHPRFRSSAMLVRAARRTAHQLRRRVAGTPILRSLELTSRQLHALVRRRVAGGPGFCVRDPAERPRFVGHYSSRRHAAPVPHLRA